MATMQPWQYESCRAIWNSGMTPADKLAGIGQQLGFANGAASAAPTTRTPTRRARTATAPTTNTTRTRKTSTPRVAASTGPRKLMDRLYAGIPETTGISRAELAAQLGIRANQAGLAIKRLGNRVVDRNGALFRADQRQRQAA